MSNSLHIGCLIANIVGGLDGKNFQREIEKFIRCNGKEWTARRVKTVFTASLHLINGTPAEAVKLYQENSISYHSSSKFPKGPFKPIVKNFVHSRRPSVKRRWASLLRIYTGLVLTSPSVIQLRKAEQDITGPAKYGPEVDKVKKAFLRQVNRVQNSSMRYERPGESLISYAQDLRGFASYYSGTPVPRPLRKKYYASFVHSYFTEPYVPSSLLEFQRYGEVDIEWVKRGSETAYPGRILFLQEGGAKGRVVAQPNARTQVAFHPLQRELCKWIRKFPESAVHDQVGGVNKLLAWLQADLPLVSYDLSAATDRIPRDIQCELLRIIGLPEFAEALDEVSSKPWISHSHGYPLSYEVGQPMGVYGSFPLLHLTNCFLARSAFHSVLRAERNSSLRSGKGFIPPEDLPFLVLGDDIVFSDRQVASVYKKMLTELGVEISPSKSFEDKVAQFAGFLFLPCRNGYTAFRPYKHPAGPRLTNPLQFLYAIGKSVGNLKRPQRWERILKGFQKTMIHRRLDLTPWELEADFTPPTSPVDSRWERSILNQLTRSAEIGTYPEELLEFRRTWSSSRGILPPFRKERMDELVGYGTPGVEEMQRNITSAFLTVPVRSLRDDPLIAQELQLGEVKPTLTWRLEQAKKRADEQNSQRSASHDYHPRNRKGSR